MFLKRLLIVLLVANIGYFAYSQGWLSGLTGGEAQQREPDRLKKQTNTEAIRVEAVPLHKADADTSSPSANATCATSKSSAEAWLVYMGPFATKDLMMKKKSELSKLNIEAREVSKTSLPLGLALGSSYATEDVARQALKKLNQNGVRTATVILWSAASSASSTGTAAANCPA